MPQVPIQNETHINDDKKRGAECAEWALIDEHSGVLHTINSRESSIATSTRLYRLRVSPDNGPEAAICANVLPILERLDLARPWNGCTNLRYLVEQVDVARRWTNSSLPVPTFNVPRHEIEGR